MTPADGVPHGTQDDALLDDYRALNDPARRREVERRGSYFVVEGALALEALLGSAFTVRSVLAAERKAERVRSLVGDRAPVMVRSDDEVEAITGFAFHRGVLASADRRALPGISRTLEGAEVVVVAEGLTDHENVGALFRNAAAFAVDAVLLDPATADPLYRRSVRVSLGQVLRVPWTRLPAWPDGLGELRRCGFELLALTPAAGAEPIGDVALNVAARQPRIALLVGAEGAGLSDAALAACDRRVRIPIAPGVDSLNVATAAAIAFHRLGRFETWRTPARSRRSG
ncbi:MAG TPA: RNA methyltransferase [Acidimicrobiales bacterium]|nr:RNA methyltransferase [Acidimicrobiales bacterium]